MQDTLPLLCQSLMYFAINSKSNQRRINQTLGIAESVEKFHKSGIIVAEL